MAIESQAYQPYKGKLTSKKVGRIALQNFRNLTSSWWTRLYLIFSFIGGLLAATVPVIYEVYVSTQISDTEFVKTYIFSGFITFSLVNIVILFSAAAAGMICDDKRYKLFPFYFSKGVSKQDYIGGKLIALIGLSSLVSVVPLALGSLIRFAFYLNDPAKFDILKYSGFAIGLLSLLIVAASSLMLGISACTERRGSAGLIWIACWVVPGILASLFSLSEKIELNDSWFSILGWKALAFNYLFAPPDPDPVGSIFAFIPIILVTIAGLAILQTRLISFERSGGL